MLVSLFCECPNFFLSWLDSGGSSIYASILNTFGGINVGSFSPFFRLRSFTLSCSCPLTSSTHCSARETVICYFGYVWIWTAFSEAALKKKNTPFPHWIPWHKPTSVFSEFSSNYFCSYYTPNMTPDSIYNSMTPDSDKQKCTSIYVTHLLKLSGMA
jgi:hypothetical protein